MIIPWICPTLSLKDIVQLNPNHQELNSTWVWSIIDVWDLHTSQNLTHYHHVQCTCGLSGFEYEPRFKITTHSLPKWPTTDGTSYLLALDEGIRFCMLDLQSGFDQFIYNWVIAKKMTFKEKNHSRVNGLCNI